MFEIVNLACKKTTFDNFDDLIKTYYTKMTNNREIKIVYKDIDIFIEKHQEKITKSTFFKGYYIKSIKGYYKDISGKRFDIKKILSFNSELGEYIVYDNNDKYNILY
jgi:hypothetical protein